jgi:hypothetical protein
VNALPAPRSVALFLADIAGRPSTLRRKFAAIAVMHRTAGHDSPTAHGVVRATFAGICRERGIASPPKPALLVDELRAVLRRFAIGRSTSATGRCCSSACRCFAPQRDRRARRRRRRL